MNVPVGTWMGSVKVNNDEVWNEYVKTGKVKGFFQLKAILQTKWNDQKIQLDYSKTKN